MAGNTPLLVFLFVLFWQRISAVPYDAFELEDEYLSDEAKADNNYRLPTTFMPEEYKIDIYDINFNNAQFKGQTIVSFKSNADNVAELKIHALNLTGTDDPASVILSDGAKTIPITIKVNDQYQMLTIKPETPFMKNILYSLKFSGYTGLMSHGMSGFYRSSYKGKETEWIGTTQMQPVHARKVFPCFDEPSFKAKFTISIERPAGYKASVSNTIGQSVVDPGTGKTLDKFAKTPTMSTYLVAFIVSKFDVLEVNTTGKTYRVLGRPEAKGQEKYAFVEGQNLVNAMSEYMGVNYYTMGNTKMDQAAIPDFSAGAMENWGLITYREGYLLQDDAATNIRFKQTIMTIMAHEIAHMWFGNYITCEWWANTWLNEGFATLYQYKMPAMIKSLNYNTMIQFPILVLQTALLADTSVRSAPLNNQNINTPAQISGHFSTISYSKGGAVIRMIENWIGEDNFKKSMKSYMTDNKEKVVTPDILYDALQKNAGTGKNVRQVMSSWVDQSGYPLLNVEIDYEKHNMKVTQERFKKAWEDQVATTYQVPINYAVQSKPDFTDTTIQYILGLKSATYDLPINGHEWVILNKKQLNYYRVNYDLHSWYMLRTALLLEKQREVIHQNNKAQIVDDLLNLAREDVISYNVTLDVLDFLEFETQYAPWQSAISGFLFIRQQLSGNSLLLSKFDDHIISLLASVIKAIGFKDDGDLLTKHFRQNLMSFACRVGHKECLTYTTDTFKAFLEKNTEVLPNHREPVYCNGLRHGDGKSFDKLWQKFKNENVVNEQLIILGTLGCTRNESKIVQLLDELVNEPSMIRDQDLTSAINSILENNVENAKYVLKYLQGDKFSALRKRLGSFSFLFTSLGAKLTGYDVNKFHQLIQDNYAILSSSELAAGMMAYNNLVQQAHYIQGAGKEIGDWLYDRYDNGSSLATSSLVLICLMSLLHLFNNMF